MKRLKNIKNFSKVEEALFFDRSELSDGNVRFYLSNPNTNKGFAFDLNAEDKEALEDILKRNNIMFDVDDGANNLPF